MEDKISKQDSKQIVDMLFDAKYFKDNVTRDDMVSVEEFITFLLQSRFDSYIRLNKLNDRIKELDTLKK